VPGGGVWEKPEVELFIGFNNEYASLGRAGQHCSQQVKHFFAPLDVKGIWRRAENQPGVASRSGELCCPNECVRPNDFDAVLHFQLGRRAANQLGRGQMPLDECRAGGAAAYGFETQGAAAGKQINGALVDDIVSQQVEDCLANSIFHGASAGVARAMDPVAAQ
jgi:hypothetical protein